MGYFTQNKNKQSHIFEGSIGPLGIQGLNGKEKQDYFLMDQS